MRKTKKRFLSALLACAMIISLFPFAAFAEDGSTIDVDGTNTTLADAISQANDGDVLKLSNNITLTQGVNVDDTLTLDLNGYTITNDESWSGSDYLVAVKRGGALTIQDNSEKKTGKIATENEKIYAAIKVTVTGENDATTPAKLVVDGGTLQGYYYGIAGNGTRHNTEITINGGTVIGTHGTGIYHPQDGVLTITNGEISGLDTAIELRSGKLNISGGSFTATATEYKEEQNGNGTTVSGAAVAISQHTTKKDISVSISGGTFNGPYALRETNVQNGESTENVDIVTISGGTFNGTVASNDCQKFVSGGTFSQQITDNYLATGYECIQQQDGKYVVQTSSKLEADAAANNGTATAVVGGNYSGSETDDSVGTTGGTVNITATTGTQGTQNDSVTTSNVTIANEALTSLNNAAGVQNVAIKTDVATVTMDSAALDAMTTNAGTDSVVLSVKKTTATGSEPIKYTVTAKTANGQTDVYDSNSAAGSVTISVPYTGTNTQVFYVGANGLEKMNATVENDVLTWTTSHFSDYVVLNDSTVATVTDNGTVNEYNSLEAAIAAANASSNNPVVDLVKDETIATSTAQTTVGIVPITKTMTINGHGNTISYTGTINTTTDPDTPQQGGLFAIGANNVVMKDATIDVKQIKHAVQFYKTTGGELNNVTINGADWTAVQVNGAQKVALNDCVLNPNAGAYANIEYALGQGVTTIPSMTMKNVSTTGDSPAIWVDDATVAAMKDAMDTTGTGDSITNEQVQKELLKQVTYTSNNGGSLKLSVEFEDGTTTPVYVESTYQPPYTGKYSYEITAAKADNGSVSVDKYATEGEKVTLTVSPDKAYKLDELTVTANGKDVDLTDNGDGTYTFTMPSSNVKVSASFVEDKDYVEPDNSITVSMTIGSNDFVINNNIVTVPDAAPYIANDRTYVPFRALGEALGAKVVWDNDARTVTYTLGDTEIVMTIGDTTYTINGVEKSMDVAPEITGDRTYVPVRFVAEGLGFKVTPLYADNGTTASVVFEK